MIAGVVFDHLAVAGPSREALLQRYAGDLGAGFVVEGPTAGLRATIVRFANGVKLEAIEPDTTEGEDFLARFLDRHGPGVHHVTFVVDDIDAAAAETEAAGFRLLGSRTTGLAEVFVHPKDASGIVVQYIEARQYGGDPPAEFPSPERSSTLDNITLVVASLEHATRLFVDILGGRVVDSDEDADERWLEASWPGEGVIRFVEPGSGTELDDWLDGRPGAVHHLTLATATPAGVPGASVYAAGVWEVEPTLNHGLRLLVTKTP
jgi:methylmalonyl-CoA/ethylmalonyl-CoA epimerase